MGSLFKAFGRGVLYVIGFPFFIVALLLFGAVGVFLFIYQLIRSIICLFTGKKFFPELPEDKELRLKREALFAANNPAPQQEQAQPQSASAPNSVVLPMMEDEPQVYQEEPMYQSNNTVENACFGQQQKYNLEPEPVKEDPLERIIEEEPEEGPAEEPMKEEPVGPIKEETIISSTQAETPKEEELEEYIPGGSSFQDIADDEDTSNGVDIKYDV